MTKKKGDTPGEELEQQLLKAIHDAQQAPLPGARDLPVLTGLSMQGRFTETQDNVVLRAIRYMADSGRVYLYGDGVVLDTCYLSAGAGRTLAPLRTGSVIEAGAEDRLANLFVCADKGGPFPVPKWFTDLLLRSELLPARLPRIMHYARRPVFDGGFVLRGPGWHPEVGILVHGEGIEPILPDLPDSDSPAVERLPHHLQTLLRGFCFRSDADVANAVAMLLTGVLANHFIVATKAMFLVDGNQPGLGKTLLVRVVGVVLDGIEPKVIKFTADDEELQKRLCATLREGPLSVILIDNAKVAGGGAVNSPTIEANSMAPEASLRILGKSENYTRPNDLLWALTMNDTRTSPDLISRGEAIRLAYEGDAKQRVFTGPDPVSYAKENRSALLGELIGMVVRWNLAGRPSGQRPHRCHEWARVIGGILGTAGLPEFLANADEAAASFDSALDELAALAEAVLKGDGPYILLDNTVED